MDLHFFFGRRRQIGVRDRLRRGAYLCELAGVDVGAERNTAMPPDFLLEQMAWREALEDARDATSVKALDREVVQRERALLERLGREIDEVLDARLAAATVRALMFVGRFREDINRRLEVLDA